MAAQYYDDPFGNDMPPLDAYADEAGAAATDRDNASESSGDFDPNSEEAYQAREAERERERNELYARLNPRQAEAVENPAVSFLVLAGAGSGKTSVLTARIAKLVSTGRAPARGVLAVTFTNKAAQEMRHRLGKLLDKRSVHELWMGTFHSLCNKLLRENYEAAGLPKSFAILDVDGQEALCRGILKDYGLTKASVKEAAKLKAAAVQGSLLAAADPLAAAGGLSADDVEDDGEANEFVTPSQCAKYISSRKESLQPPAPPQSISTRSTDVEQMEAVYAEYQSRCAKSGLLDFQDLLTRGVELLKKDPMVRDSYRSRFSVILVDEFQDTNDIQYEWLQLMKGNNAHVMAVGDDSQSIYGFRGANPANMQRFVDEMTKDKTAPEGRVVKLEQNYRSLPHILEAANAIIDRNPNQLKKTLFTSQRDRGERIDLVTFGNGMFEASSIAQSIHRMVKEMKVPPAEIAVLYRTNQQSRLLEQELNKLGVPLTVYGGFRFYERQEVKHMMAYLDLVCDMTRDISFGRVVNFPPRGIGERTIEELRQDAQLRKLSMLEMVGERSEKMARDPALLGGAAAQKKQRQLEGFTDIILDLADAAQTMPLSQLIEQVMERAGIRQHYLDEAGGSKSSQEEAEERLANIAELVSASKQFEIDNPQLTTAADQLPEYLAYVALMTSTSESDMSRKNTVSLMTVHSSKGLEFDHVFIAGLEEATFPHARAIKEDEERGNGKSIDQALRDMGATTDDQGNDLLTDEPTDVVDGEGMQEERRLMYVAVTRARKTLTITHAKERLMNGEAKACEPSRFIDEIPDHRLNRIEDAKARHSNKKPYLRDTSNREYGGDAFDQGRSEYRPRGGKPAAAPAARRPELRTQTSFADEQMTTDPILAGAGSVRVVSKRKGGVTEAAGETVIDVDRNHPVLGNRHVLTNHEDADERRRVIAAFDKDFKADMAVQGPMFKAVNGLAERVAGGERLALRCWCAPRDCHVDIIADKVATTARALVSARNMTDKHPELSGQPGVVAILAAAEAVSGKQVDASDLAKLAATARADAGETKLKPWQRRGAAALAAQAQAQAARPALKAVEPPSWLAKDGATRTVAIIGTAGRDKDKPMTAQLWERMVADAKQRVRPDDTLVSGGAAWADHLAVRLYLDGDVKHLILHLPAPFVDGKFQGERESAASAANYYHDMFRRNAGVDGFADLAAAIAKGAKVTEQPAAKGYGAMFARNALVAKQADTVVAYTFGEGDTPADGGTKDTWDQVKGSRQHVPLLSLGALATTRLPASSPTSSAVPARTAPPSGAMARLDLLGNRNRRGSRP
jgi:DNA helicase-2/ATP-dependent DNA helicase PcrA